MYVCGSCVVFHANNDYSGTDWTESRAEDIAENLKDYVIHFDEDPHFTMDYCSGCGVRGFDAYRAEYYDEAI